MKIIITGAYAIGTHLARLLSRNQEEITIIDDDQSRLDKIGADYDLLTLCGSPSSLKTLREAGTANADLFIAVSPDENENINSCILAHALHAKKTVAKVNDAEYVEEDVRQFYKDLGVDVLIYPEILAAKEINNGLKMSWVRQRWDVHGGALVMLAIKLRSNCKILNQPLKDLCGPDDPYHVVAIKRGRETIIPGGNDELHCFDLAYFMTTKQYIPYIREACSGSTTGGLKCVRCVMILKVLKNELVQRLHPNAVLPLKISDANIPDKQRVSLLAFVAAYLLLFFIFAFVIIAAGVDNTNAITICLSCLSNVGPTLGTEIGPTMSWSELPAFIKWFCSFMMLVGRLEIFTVIVVLTPEFWRKN